ncbi:MAG: hypothetical protein ACLFQQ_08875 [Desulfococcaceae bacterium]
MISAIGWENARFGDPPNPLKAWESGNFFYTGVPIFQGFPGTGGEERKKRKGGNGLALLLEKSRRLEPREQKALSR